MDIIFQTTCIEKRKGDMAKKTLALSFYTTIPSITSKIGFLLTYVLYESFYPN